MEILSKIIKNENSCSHKEKEKLSYLDWINMAERKHKKGLKQKQCPMCKLWIWEDEF